MIIKLKILLLWEEEDGKLKMKVLMNKRMVHFAFHTYAVEMKMP